MLRGTMGTGLVVVLTVAGMGALLGLMLPHQAEAVLPQRVEGTLIARAEIEIADLGPVALSVSQVRLLSDAATEQRAVPGPVLLLIREGTVVVDGPGRSPEIPIRLVAGDRATLPTGAVVRLRNRAQEPSTILVVGLLPTTAAGS